MQDYKWVDMIEIRRSKQYKSDWLYCLRKLTHTRKKKYRNGKDSYGCWLWKDLLKTNLKMKMNWRWVDEERIQVSALEEDTL